jgi:hypothetical protein
MSPPIINNLNTPKSVPKVQTKYRRIVTSIPVPESIPILEALRNNEPASFSGQPPVVWDRASGIWHLAFKSMTNGGTCG